MQEGGPRQGDVYHQGNSESSIINKQLNKLIITITRVVDLDEFDSVPGPTY